MRQRHERRYALGDVAFTLVAIYFVLTAQWTNALVAWGVSEVYALHRRVS